MSRSTGLLCKNNIRTTSSPSARHEWRLHLRGLPLYCSGRAGVYASPGWSGFCSASDVNKLDRFLSRCKCLNYCNQTTACITEQLMNLSSKLLWTCLLWTSAQRKRASMLYFVNVLFIYFLWPLYSPAMVNGSSRKFYTWWTLSVIREVTTWIFSCSSLNYSVGQKVTKFGVCSDPTCKLSSLTPERGRIL